MSMLPRFQDRDSSSLPTPPFRTSSEQPVPFVVDLDMRGATRFRSGLKSAETGM